MRYFYDCEFLEDGRTIDLISIGIVAEDGREYHAANLDAPWKRIYKHRWLTENVIPHLPAIRGDRRFYATRANPYAIDFQHPLFRRSKVIADEVCAFLVVDDDPQLWAWYGDFDHVTLSWLWGDMSAHPDGIPMYTGDLKQEHDRLQRVLGREIELPEQPAGEHDALADARHNAVRARALDELALSVLREDLR